MFGWLKPKTPSPPPRPASSPADTRLYAIGDIHGRLDLLNNLLDQIETDCRDFSGDKHLVFLGDYIDRGPQSKGVIDRLMAPMPAGLQPVFLMGNHEWAMLRFFELLDTGSGWLMYGGLETLKSYGIELRLEAGANDRLSHVQQRLREDFPPEHRSWLASCPTWFELGDYYFVHAGVRPAIALDQQSDMDRLWIRKGFLDWQGGGLPKMIVHGHTISENVEIRPHRIGIDTGAYASNRLTALVLEGTGCRILQT